MAISEKTIKQMQKDIHDIKRQLARRQRHKTARLKSTAKPRTSRSRSVGERADEILRAAGLLSESTAKEKQRIAQWRAVSPEERKRLVEEFRALKLDKPLSQIVIENRR
jgi:hypothetical protein